jgi:hypothetical protein
MKRPHLALEELGEETPETEEARLETEVAAIPEEEVTEERVDADTVAVQDGIDQARGEADAIDEAEGMAEAIDTMADTVEQVTGEGGEGVTPETAQVIEAAMEHFYTRLGINRSRKLPAMESFEKDRLGSSKAALEELRALHARIDKNLTVAQEGFVDRFVNGLSRVFTTNSKMYKVSKALNASNLKEVHELGAPAWARIFSASGKAHVNAADVIHVFEGYLNLANGDVMKLLDETVRALRTVKLEQGRAVFSSADGAIDTINKLKVDLEGKIKKINTRLPDAALNKKDVTISSCDKGSFDKIAKLIQRSASDRRMVTAFQKTFDQIYSLSEDNPYGVTKEGRAVRSLLIGVASDLNELALGIAHGQIACTHGAYKYLKASCGK